MIEEWVSEVQSLMVSDKEEMKVLDDVNGNELPVGKVGGERKRGGRLHGVEEEKGVVPESECWEVTGE
eukprot:2876253-Karenia_brevis.AAC.1